ncbi:hypothetical protein H6A24_02235 [Bacteroides caecicola]|uniref:Virulence protein n=1 Tax=Bacteroides caecicola TaxID=1462569 RepID=A0ABS2F516_9BACE|nr:hypothetical protein [Bacteroides caecicola]MBM6805322.1 hypothetical protein [Bacteroides caecicola]
MKREPITINESGNIIIQTSNSSEIWMNEPELISFFNVIAPTFRAAVRTVYKKGTLNPGLVEKRIKQKDGCYENFYNVEMIFALAFLLDTYPADRLRKYLITKAIKENAAPFVCIIGKNHSYLKC